MTGVLGNLGVCWCALSVVWCAACDGSGNPSGAAPESGDPSADDVADDDSAETSLDDDGPGVSQDDDSQAVADDDSPAAADDDSPAAADDDSGSTSDDDAVAATDDNEDAPAGDDDAPPPDTMIEGLEPPGPDASAMQACRHYFGTICARIRECEAPTYRPCESPQDLCPDALFSDGSSWTIPEVLDCAQIFASHSCDDLMVDRWPACSQRAGSRPEGAGCVFDSQCGSALCVGGVIPEYTSSCGQCVTPVSTGEACSDELACAMGQVCFVPPPCGMGQECPGPECRDIVVPEPEPESEPGPVPVPATPTGPVCDDATPCLPGYECQDGSCQGVDTDPLPEGAPCSRRTECQEGLVCGIELFADEDDEPDQGFCEPLAPIGEPCVPTFGRVGRCVEGGTCDSRPSGDCVPLREIGESCGYTQCVDGAYCQIYSAITDVESHMCYADRQRGEPCFGQDVICADGLECLCPGEGCVEEICEVAHAYGEPCDGVTELCSGSTECRDGICGGMSALIPDGPPPVLGEPCVRTLSFGRISGNCDEDDPTIECLCTDIECTEAYCGLGRVVGESCNNRTELCRYGYACENDVCVPLDSLDLDGRVCGP